MGQQRKRPPPSLSVAATSGASGDRRAPASAAAGPMPVPLSLVMSQQSGAVNSINDEFRGIDHALMPGMHPMALLAQFPDVKRLPLMPLRRETRTEGAITGCRRRGQHPSKSNSERGKIFRARQQQYEVDLMKVLTSLQSEIYDLQVVRNVRSECTLQTRNAYTGSLLKLAREYHALFYIGVPDPSVGEKRLGAAGYQDLITRQQLYLEHAFDPDFRLGGQPGMATIIEEWKRYTRYHSDLSTRADEFEICGTDEKPVVVAHGRMQVRYTRRTLEYVFPHVFHDAALVQRFVGKEVVYTYRNVYEFSADGRIMVYDTVVDFVQPLLDAGSSIEDVSRLMQQARIVEQYKLGPADDEMAADTFSMVEETHEHDMDLSDMPESTPSPREVPRTNCKHDMNFILSSAQ
ncbi:hypothetical protein FI667_g12210, partial [Globisporangium splendens]